MATSRRAPHAIEPTLPATGSAGDRDANLKNMGARPGIRWRMLALALLALLLAMILLWLRWPDASRPTIAGMLGVAERGRASPIAPLIAFAGFAVSGIVVFPVDLLIAATIVVFGPLAGAAYALVGSVLSAEVVYEIGRRLPASALNRVMGARGERLRMRIVGYGFAAVALVRLVPVAPYSIVSFVAGAARIRRAPYLIGTAVGMMPGIVLYALFADRARAVLLDPHPLAWIGLAAAIALIVVVAFVVRKRLSRIVTTDDMQ
ncbi:MAG: VTT domain-containing protein [Dokdonella sp.]